MTSLNWWKRSLMIAGMAGFAVLASKPWQVRSAEPAQENETFKYYGSTTCKQCHHEPSNSQKILPASKGFIRFDEWTIWNQVDKHSIAFQNLTTERGRRMASLLHVEDVTRPEVGCIGCHSASVGEMKNRQGSAFDPSEGVSCENCHGPYSGWSAVHQLPPFRTLRKEEWTKVGFVDLRTPEGKAEKCLSCHIGNVDQAKVVTHEMYAAGHPPLPSIEVATFTNAIPRHWSLHSERKDEKISLSLGYQLGQLEQAKLAIVGASVALKTSMKLLADEARATPKEGAAGHEWPDYARFDCWSCHHDLKRDGWRQAREDQKGPPGRVPVSEWPLTLVDLGIDRLVMDDPAAEALRTDQVRLEKALRTQLNSRPFGRPEAVAKLAGEYAAWADVLIKKLGAASFDRPVAAKLLRKLVARAERSTPDYDAARHVGWTIKVLVDDLGNTLAEKPRIDAIVDQMTKGLKLDLPSGRYYKIEEQIGEALSVIGDYDPSTFKAQLSQLLPLLP